YCLTEPKFHLNFRNANPVILLTLLIAVILNVFRHITHPWCNAALGLLNMLLKTILGTPAHSHASSSQLPSEAEHEYIPHDICTIHKKFDLEPATQTLAACVRCSCTYVPVAKGKITTYP
ncbi:hypothetical protein HYDPIDRAFT_68756, partial [Hydnomerulius pinastri MD-312]